MEAVHYQRKLKRKEKEEEEEKSGNLREKNCHNHITLKRQNEIIEPTSCQYHTDVVLTFIHFENDFLFILRYINKLQIYV